MINITEDHRGFNDKEIMSLNCQLDDSLQLAVERFIHKSSIISGKRRYDYG
jgi:hypothetical protein